MRLTLLHLGDELLVEQTPGLLMQGAVNGDDVALSKHLLEVLDAAAADLLLDLGLERLVVVVEQLLAVEGLKAAQDTLTNATDGNGADHLVLQVVLVLGYRRDVPVTRLNLLVRRHEVAHQRQDGHYDVLRNRHHVRARHLRNCDTAIGLVRGVQVNVIRTNTSSDGQLQVLGLSQALGREVTGVEAIMSSHVSQFNHPHQASHFALRLFVLLHR